MNLLFKNFKKTPSREELIYEECHKSLFYTSFRILNNRMEAEEVMHDTLLKYFDREDFDTIRERNAWLKRVCINLSIDRLRKRKVEEGIFKSDELKNPVIENEYADNYSFKGISVDDVKNALNLLASGYRLVLSLLLFEGYDYEEIAQITGLKEASVRSQYIRGKARIVEILESKRSNRNIN